MDAPVKRGKTKIGFPEARRPRINVASGGGWAHDAPDPHIGHDGQYREPFGARW